MNVTNVIAMARTGIRRKLSFIPLPYYEKAFGKHTVTEALLLGLGVDVGQSECHNRISVVSL
jgi:Tfp pilus assembly major pilin PilA